MGRLTGQIKGVFFMSEEFGSDYITIIDDDGNEFELEHLDTIEVGDTLYMAFLPADLDEEHEDFGLIILKVIEEDGEESFISIDDEEELEAVHERFMAQLFADEDETVS